MTLQGTPPSPPERPIPPRTGPPGLRERLSLFPLTFSLIGLTALVFLGQAVFGFDRVISLGAKINERIAAGEYWRLITPIFIHAGLLHFGVNMYSLYAIGPPVERFLGAARMAALYLMSGFCGVLFSVAFTPQVSIGASGAIFGLLGALAVVLYTNRATFGRAGAFQLRQIAIVALLNLFLGLSPGIDNWGHLGGLLAGALLTAFIGPRFELLPDATGRVRLIDRRPWREVRLLTLIAALGLVLIALVLVQGR